MQLSRTPDVDGLVFSPWELRPGTTVQVDYSYVHLDQISWDSDTSLTVTLSGTVWPTSVKCAWPVDDVTITPSGLYNIVSVGPVYHGTTDLDIYYKIEKSESLTAVSAITETSYTYYNDWFTDDTGTVTPMTVVPMTLPVSQQLYKPDDFTVTFDQPERGVTVLNGDSWTSNSVGTLKMIDHSDDFSMSRNLFRKGVTQVLVPMACTIEPVVRYNIVNGSKEGKYVEVDLQEWSTSRLSVRGILWHRDKLYVMTDNGMYSFDRWGDFSTYDAHYENVTGYDMTYADGDLFLVTEGATVKVYKVRHDFNHYDKTTEVMRFREANSDFKLE